MRESRHIRAAEITTHRASPSSTARNHHARELHDSVSSAHIIGMVGGPGRDAQLIREDAGDDAAAVVAAEANEHDPAAWGQGHD